MAKITTLQKLGIAVLVVSPIVGLLGAVISVFSSFVALHTKNSGIGAVGNEITHAILFLVGGLIGCLLALPTNGISSAAGGANFAEVAFAFRIAPAALAIGLIFAVVMGIIGGMLPAVKASRMPITSALREA